MNDDDDDDSNSVTENHASSPHQLGTRRSKDGPNDTNYDSRSTQWWKRLRESMLSILSQAKDDVDSSEQQRRLRNRAIQTVATFVLIYYLRRTRRGKRPSSLFPSLWKSRSLSNEYRRAIEAPLSLLVNAAKSGSVQRARIMASQAAIAYQVDGSWKRSNLPPNNPSLQSNLLEMLAKGGCTDVVALPESLWSRLATPALAALPFVYLALVYRMMRSMYGKDDAARTYSDDMSLWEQTTFQQVAGIDNAVRDVSEIVSYLSNPTLYHRLGARPPNGVLLFGPPGSGKTLLARAIAGEAHCNAFLACSGSDFVDTYVGRGAARVRELFDRARRDARHGDGNHRHWLSSWYGPSKKPTDRIHSAVIFIDEIDALAKSRSAAVFGNNNDERDHTLNQLLAEMDGFAVHDDVTMIVIAATNRPDVLDPAILRRFDRKVHVGHPDAEGRKAILLVHARRIHCNIDEVDWERLAALSSDFSGADLRNVTNEAALMAVRQGHSMVDQHHLELATERVKRMKAQVQETFPPCFGNTF